MTTALRIRRLRQVGIAEAVSFLALGVAMGFKYGLGEPLGVRILGPLHGGLFLLYLAALVVAWRATRWPVVRVALLAGAAILPAGPFLGDAWLRRQELAAQPPA